jgi:Flp pilus assembly protein CpaB
MELAGRSGSKAVKIWQWIAFVSMLSVGTLLGVLSFRGDTTTKTTPEGERAPPVAVPAPQPALVVPDGMRAVTVAVGNDPFRDSIVPGSRLDLLVTLPDAEDPQKSITSVLVEGVLLLASKPPQGVSSVYRITIAVTEDEAQQVEEAKFRGALSYALHKPDK